MKQYIIAPAIALTALLFGTATAHADTGDMMYAVGTDIQPGTYRYTVTGHDWGDWELCGDANCGDPIAQSGVINGEGHTGRLTVTPGAGYLKLHYLTLSRS
jgi:hypothetical protein